MSYLILRVATYPQVSISDCSCAMMCLPLCFFFSSVCAWVYKKASRLKTSLLSGHCVAGGECSAAEGSCSSMQEGGVWKLRRTKMWRFAALMTPRVQRTNVCICICVLECVSKTCAAPLSSHMAYKLFPSHVRVLIGVRPLTAAASALAYLGTVCAPLCVRAISLGSFATPPLASCCQLDGSISISSHRLCFAVLRPSLKACIITDTITAVPTTET